MRAWLRAVWLAALVSVPTPVEAEFSPQVVPAIRQAVDRHNELTELDLPPLDDEQLEELRTGEVVRFRWRQPIPGETEEGEPRESHRVVAFHLVEAPMVRVWLAVLDPHFPADDRVTEVFVEHDDRGNGTLYQFMDLPWPVRNRHWVIRVRKGIDVAAGSQGRIWQHSWNLIEHGEEIAYEVVAAGRAEGVDLDEAKGARYLEANIGAWALFALDENLTLMTFQATVELGGWIPDRLAARFAAGSLEKLCRTVAANSATMPEHYDVHHAPIYGGDGLPIAAPIAGAPFATGR